jgi:hypothetical protein
MDEQEWLACADRTVMLSHLEGQVTERQLRLFAVACCRHVWDLLPDQRSRAAVEVAERCADRLVDARQQASILGQALAAANRTTGRAAWAPYWAAKKNISESVWNACEAALDGTARHAVYQARAAGADQASAWEDARSAGARDQARLLRDILGNPFRPAKLDAAWLDWQGGLVPALARRIYDERDFTGLAILADALEDAGCDDADVLSHCRSGDDHVRGCWALDLILATSR